MNRFFQSAAVLPLLAFGAAAQDTAQLDAVKKKMAEDTIVRMNVVGAVKGPLVKGMPYSADEITEVDQTLADGTRIHRETKVSVYRDTEGRTRRESPDSVTISDPVAGTTYVINPKTNTVRKLEMSNTMIYRTMKGAPGAAGLAAGASEDGKPTTFSLRTSGDGQANIEINGKQLDPKAVAELIAKAKAEGAAEFKSGEVVVVNPRAGTVLSGDAAMTGPMLQKFAWAGQTKGTAESLGTKSIEGVIAQGTRNVETIETGAIGNDRPIEIVNEHWYSDELGMMVYSKRSDPRTGDETFRVTNIQRGDPPASLFQPPPDARGNANAGSAERKM